MSEKDKNNNAIDKSTAKQVLKQSGYLLESRVEEVLRNLGYSVTPNRHYPDAHSGKYREIDLVAVRSEFFANQLGKFDNLTTKLLVECVNNPQLLGKLSKRPILCTLGS